jgi:hypothetical protein
LKVIHWELEFGSTYLLNALLNRPLGDGLGDDGLLLRAGFAGRAAGLISGATG